MVGLHHAGYCECISYEIFLTMKFCASHSRGNASFFARIVERAQPVEPSDMGLEGREEQVDQAPVYA